MHLTSLPSKYGIGDFGPGAYGFVDWMEKSKLSYWQVLPLNPTSVSEGNSPYSSSSAFALNLLLISPEKMVEDNFLTANDIQLSKPLYSKRALYGDAEAYKNALLDLAYARFIQSGNNHDFDKFREEEAGWLNDYALFRILQKEFKGKVWDQWPTEFRDRHEGAIQDFVNQHLLQLNKIKFIQFIAFRQWMALKKYSNEKGIQLIGDIPIYVHYNSADVWANQEMFKLDEDKKPIFVAGVPPDYFSETGQLWGNPVYNWQVLEQNNFKWWIKRLKQNTRLFDMVRIDHFRGLVAYWEVAADEKTAMNGRWVQVPSDRFFDELRKQFPALPLIAEDLGLITPDVKEFLSRTGLPGMKVLQFGLMSMDPGDGYLPHNCFRNTILYTGTHDNNTVKGWYQRELNRKQKKFLNEYTGKKITSKNVHLEMIRLCLFSVANTAIFPMQDILGLSHKYRMNTPARAKHNWEWKLEKDLPGEKVTAQLARMIILSGRA